MRIFLAILFVFVFVEREACEKCSPFKSSSGNWFPSLSSWKTGIEIIKHTQNNLSSFDKEYWNLLMQCLQYNTQSTNNTSVHMVLMCPSIQSFNFSPPPQRQPPGNWTLEEWFVQINSPLGGGIMLPRFPTQFFFRVKCKISNLDSLHSDQTVKGTPCRPFLLSHSLVKVNYSQTSLCNHLS